MLPGNIWKVNNNQMTYEKITPGANERVSAINESLEQSYSRLKGLMKTIVNEIKKDLRNNFAQEDGFVDSDGSIRMNNFYDSSIES